MPQEGRNEIDYTVKNELVPRGQFLSYSDLEKQINLSLKEEKSWAWLFTFDPKTWESCKFHSK